jgi:hypothetical protein
MVLISMILDQVSKAVGYNVTASRQETSLSRRTRSLPFPPVQCPPVHADINAP